MGKISSFLTRNLPKHLTCSDFVDMRPPPPPDCGSRHTLPHLSMSTLFNATMRGKTSFIENRLLSIKRLFAGDHTSRHRKTSSNCIRRVLRPGVVKLCFAPLSFLGAGCELRHLGLAYGQSSNEIECRAVWQLYAGNFGGISHTPCAYLVSVDGSNLQ
ncbi:hypothetical protein X801_03640, partial [Opisthorchis viverrini]